MVIRLTVLLSLLLFLWSCQDAAPDLLLRGNLGEEFNGELQLTQQGDLLEGTFTYTNGPQTSIPLKGTLFGDQLRLEEFNGAPNEITGVFAGEFDGTNYRGNWQDATGKSIVPFLFSTIAGPVAEKDAQRENGSIEIEYTHYDHFLGDLHNSLKATIGDKEYSIIKKDETALSCFTVIDVRDFDGNGVDDALLKWHGPCGGNVIPHYNLSFCTYDPAEDAFILSEHFASINENPDIEKWEGKWSLSFYSYNAYQMYEARERYVLRDGKAVQVEYVESKPLVALVEIYADQFTEAEKRRGKSFRFDLNEDGQAETIHAEYWDRWNSLFWTIRYPSGQSERKSMGCKRIGVLPTTTKGYHDLVCGLNYVFVWGGKEYTKGRKRRTAQ